MKNNLLFLADSYKYSHSSQYPCDMKSMYSYMESRGGKYDEIVFVGLSYYIQEYLTETPTLDEVEATAKLCAQHGVPFDYEGWRYISKLRYYPIEIKAIPEGSVIKPHLPIMTIRSTDHKVPWLAGFVETLLMKLWYPINIATKSYHVKKMLLNYGSPEWANFAYHCFGDRGSSSVESAAIGGFAHLTQFLGTDNFNTLNFVNKYYPEFDNDNGYTLRPPENPIAGYSVFATEHSTTTSWTKDNEYNFVLEQLRLNPTRSIMSFVADSYDVYNFVNFCTSKDYDIRGTIELNSQTLVMRPDSGDPIEVISKCLSIMLENDAEYDLVNGKILFRRYRILWGDGITEDTIKNILDTFTTSKEPSLFGEDHIFAAENFIFGSGGDLMTNHTRDTNKFAIKCSMITRFDGTKSIDVPVFKDPITDPGKKSKSGYVSTVKDEEGNYVLFSRDLKMNYYTALYTYFNDGQIGPAGELPLSKIRENSSKHLIKEMSKSCFS